MGDVENLITIQQEQPRASAKVKTYASQRKLRPWSPLFFLSRRRSLLTFTSDRSGLRLFSFVSSKQMQPAGRQILEKGNFVSIPPQIVLFLKLVVFRSNGRWMRWHHLRDQMFHSPSLDASLKPTAITSLQPINNIIFTALWTYSSKCPQSYLSGHNGHNEREVTGASLWATVGWSKSFGAPSCHLSVHLFC